MVPRGVYDTLKAEREKVEYSESQIDRMIESYQAQFSRIQQNTQSIMNASGGNNVPNNTANYRGTPFGN